MLLNGKKHAADLELMAKWKKVKSIVNGRDITIDIGHYRSMIWAGGNVIGSFDWPIETINFVVNNEEFLKLKAPKICLDVIDEEDDLLGKDKENDMVKLAFFAGWKYGKHYGDLWDKEYCCEKFLELLNKKIKKEEN